MISKSKLNRKSFPALVREFDEVLNSAMNEAVGYHGAAEVMSIYLTRMEALQREVTKRMGGIGVSLKRCRLMAVARDMSTAIWNQKDRLAIGQQIHNQDTTISLRDALEKPHAFLSQTYGKKCVCGQPKTSKIHIPAVAPK